MELHTPGGAGRYRTAAGFRRQPSPTRRAPAARRLRHERWAAHGHHFPPQVEHCATLAPHHAAAPRHAGPPHPADLSSWQHGPPGEGGPGGPGRGPGGPGNGGNGGDGPGPGGPIGHGKPGGTGSGHGGDGPGGPGAGPGGSGGIGHGSIGIGHGGVGAGGVGAGGGAGAWHSCWHVGRSMPAESTTHLFAVPRTLR